MIFKLPKNLVEIVMEKDAELADYLHSQDYNLVRDINLDTLDIPIKYVEQFVVFLRTDIDRRIKANEKGECDYHLDRDIEHQEELEKEVIESTTKLKNKAKSLIRLSAKIKRIFEQELGVRFWMYREEKGFNVPCLIKSVKYEPKGSGRDYANIEIKVVVNRKHHTCTESLDISSDIFRECKKDAYEVLKYLGLKFETPALYRQYKKDDAEYTKKSSWQNKQVIGNGTKYINDNIHHRNSQPSYKFQKKMTSNFDAKYEPVDIPHDSNLYLYDLSEHDFTWIKAQQIELYKYDASISKKLILPEEHKNLIDILLSKDITELGSDIIVGKGGGTLILTKGGAGLGKTATAEIFSEKKESPLLSIHSGQLGTNGDSIERKLKEIFVLAERWGCILLIDEADVYIRKRGDDINHNTIVSTFLRTMEYYCGVLFMTTNRTDDVDEAIESRCIAVLNYVLPSKQMSKELWKLFITQYNIKVTDDTYKEVCKKMTKLAGRDIKNICMLVSRYSQGMKIDKPEFEHFKLCATFRGKYSIGGEH